MLAIQNQKGSSQKACIPNILPCKIHHNGKVNATQRHWDPRIDEQGKETSYFRGRKLNGRTMKLPQGYCGVVVEKTNRILPIPTRMRENAGPSNGYEGAEEEDDDDNDDEPLIEVKVLNQLASFDRFTVWGHETVPDDTEDSYIKGVEEFLQFTQAMNSYDDEE